VNRPSSFRRVALALALLSAGASAGPVRAAVVEEIVAKINNRIITKSEFDERTQYLIQQTVQDAKGKDFQAELQQAKDALLANLITEALLIERAETIFDFDKIRVNLIDDFRKQQNIADDAELEKALKEQGMTRKELEEHLLRLAVPNEIINYDVRRKISVSQAEMDAYFAEHHAQWETPATITFREIVLPYEKDGRDQSLALAKGVVEQARSGSSDFVELVHKFSLGGSREVDGLIGPVSARDLNQAIAGSAFALKPGDVSDPIDTGRTFDVVKIEAKADATAKTLVDVKDDVYNAVREEKFRPRFDIYLKRLWKENTVEVVPKYQSLLVVSPLTADKPKPPA
jgi:peptidyl-prolyl cis-trans isomerase SurA